MWVGNLLTFCHGLQVDEISVFRANFQGLWSDLDGTNRYSDFLSPRSKSPTNAVLIVKKTLKYGNLLPQLTRDR
jgi:hypothetical protein